MVAYLIAATAPKAMRSGRAGVSMTSQIINVGIVLIGIYIALAVLCSWAQEQIAAFLRLRAKTLIAGVARLVSEDADTLSGVASHPLIQSACEASERFPSYIEPRNFTLAFWHTLAKTNAVAAASDPHTAFVNLIGDVSGWTPSGAAAEQVKKSAVALLTAAQGDYDKLLVATDAWFDSQMDRVTGWYKRNTQFVLISLALFVSFGLGVDSIDIARQLFLAPAVSKQPPTP